MSDGPTRASFSGRRWSFSLFLPAKRNTDFMQRSRRFRESSMRLASALATETSTRRTFFYIEQHFILMKKYTSGNRFASDLDQTILAHLAR
jgi:hypothetical protein